MTILLAIYIVSFVDRTIINMMVKPIEADLGISDFQLSLLIGPAFGIFYVTSGLLMGWLVDRFSRRLVALGGVISWGVFTTFCGFTGSFAQLAIGRAGVGIGESTLTPAAHAIIAENFPPRRLSTAMSVFTLGSVVGTGLALVLGGWIAHFVAGRGLVALPLVGAIKGWHAVFLVVGLCTLLLAPLALLIPEPPHSRPGRGLHPEALPEIGLRSLIGQHWRLYLVMPIAFGFTTVLIAAFQAWAPTFMMRAYGLDPGRAGLLLGIQTIVAGALGQIGNAMIVDRLYARGYTDAHARFHIVGLFVTVPLAIWSFYAHTVWGFLALGFAFNCLTYPFVAYAAAALQLFTPGHLRGRVSAMFLAIITIIGTSIGAPLTAFLTDHVFGNKARIGDALALVTVIVAPVIFALLLVAARAMRQMHAERAAR